MTDISRKECFVITPIGDELTEIRKYADAVLEVIIIPIAEEFGYTVIRADRIMESGSITRQLIEHLLQASLIIADLTFHNPNVFYELGICHAFKRPFIQIAQDTEQRVFDVADLRTIRFVHTDMRSVEACKTQMREQIKAIQSGIEIVTPVSEVINLESLKSKDPVVSSIASISATLEQLVREVSIMRSSMPSSDSNYRSTEKQLVHSSRIREPERELNKEGREIATILSSCDGQEIEGILMSKPGKFVLPQFSSYRNLLPSVEDRMKGKISSFSAIDNMTNKYWNIPYYINKDISDTINWIKRQKHQFTREYDTDSIVFWLIVRGTDLPDDALSDLPRNFYITDESKFASLQLALDRIDNDYP